MQFRTSPIGGEVIGIPITKTEWAYVVYVHAETCYLHKFTSNGILNDHAIFKNKEWMFPLLYGPLLPVNHRTICFIDIKEDEKHPWMLLDERNSSPSGTFIATNGVVRRSPTTEELSTLPPFCYKEPPEFPAFIAHLYKQMTVVEGDLVNMPPLAEVEKLTEVRYEIDTGTYEDENRELEYDIIEIAETSQLDLDGLHSDIPILLGHIKDANQILSAIRRGIQQMVPPEHWKSMKIYRFGPNDDDDCCEYEIETGLG